MHLGTGRSQGGPALRASMFIVSGRWPGSSAHDVIRFSASTGRVRRFVHIERPVAMTHAESIKPMKNLRTKHVGGLAGSWLSRFAGCFWIKNGTRVGVCSLSFAAETMCFEGPGQPLFEALRTSGTGLGTMPLSPALAKLFRVHVHVGACRHMLCAASPPLMLPLASILPPLKLINPILVENTLTNPILMVFSLTWALLIR
jgi:hypothetical protein